jgi:hypothetical protein
LHETNELENSFTGHRLRFPSGYCIDRSNDEAIRKRNTVTTVWAPLAASGRRIPYVDVQIITQDRDYIKFRTKEGEVIEQHGDYTVQTRQRTSND